MFEQLKDHDGNVFTPVWGAGGMTHYSVNGSKDTVASRRADPNVLRWKAAAQGLLPEPAIFGQEDPPRSTSER